MHSHADEGHGRMTLKWMTLTHTASVLNNPSVQFLSNVHQKAEQFNICI